MRIQVVTILAVAGALTGGLVGFALGLIPVDDVSPLVAIPAALLDALRIPTLSVRRQVPQYWGRIFDPRTTALLYGARLGVGPLTILPTWLWWAATLIGSSRGPWVGALTGVTFALVRTTVMWLAGTRARRMDRADRTIRVGVMVAVAVVALAACSGKDEAAPTPTMQLEPSSSTTSAATSTTTARTDLLIDHALDGFATVRDETLDLDDAAAAEVDPDAERALLQTRGFVSGVARTWSGPGDDVVLATSYQLGSKEQAELYLLDGAETLRAHDAKPFEVPDVPGAFGFTTTEDSFVAHAVAFTRGDRWYLVLVGSTKGTRTEAEAAQLALLQAALIG